MIKQASTKSGVKMNRHDLSPLASASDCVKPVLDRFSTNEGHRLTESDVDLR
jgi:hypothetical protein